MLSKSLVDDQEIANLISITCVNSKIKNFQHCLGLMDKLLADMPHWINSFRDNMLKALEALSVPAPGPASTGLSYRKQWLYQAHQWIEWNSRTSDCHSLYDILYYIACV
jgi:hypothetical protein